MTHQVGVSEAELEGKDEVRKDSISGKTVSFDNPEVKGPKERISFDQPPDLFVTSMTPAAEPNEAATAEPKVEVAEASPKADASNTGTAKRKKKKRDEVGRKFP